MRIIATTPLLIIALVWATSAPADDGKEKQPAIVQQTVLEISRDTTRITKPLDKWGFVDYVRAANEFTARGVTPENNFENVVRKIMGPKEIMVAAQEEYHRRLGMKVPKPPFMKDYFEFQVKAPRKAAMDEYNHAIENPWSATDYPDVASWLESERERLDALVEGSKRSHFYSPYMSGDPDEEPATPQMIAILLPSVQEMRHLARMLVIRANRNIADGDLDAAWTDIQTIYRISRLTAQGITLIEPLVGIAMDGMAFQATVTVLKSPALTDQQLQKFLADLNQLPHFPSMSEKIDTGERWSGLDAVQTLARQGNLFKALNMIDALSADQPFGFRNGTTLVVMQKEKPAAKPNIAPLVNWNVTAKSMNQWYDRLVVAAAVEFDYEKRKRLFAQIEADLDAAGKNVTGGMNALAILFAGKPRDELGKMFGDILAALMLPAVEAVCVAQFEAAERLDVLRFAFAAESFRRETGGYPRQLDELLPKYHQAVPTDRFSGKPLVYRPAKNGFVVYSVGRNSKDNLGRGHDDRGDRRVDWDDVVIRVKTAN